LSSSMTTVGTASDVHPRWRCVYSDKLQRPFYHNVDTGIGQVRLQTWG
jgi:hypothetical protein